MRDADNPGRAEHNARLSKQDPRGAGPVEQPRPASLTGLAQILRLHSALSRWPKPLGQQTYSRPGWPPESSSCKPASTPDDSPAMELQSIRVSCRSSTAGPSPMPWRRAARSGWIQRPQPHRTKLEVWVTSDHLLDPPRALVFRPALQRNRATRTGSKAPPAPVSSAVREPRHANREWFIQKDHAWWLRELSKRDLETVRGWLAAHDNLNLASKRRRAPTARLILHLADTTPGGGEARGAEPPEFFVTKIRIAPPQRRAPLFPAIFQKKSAHRGHQTIGTRPDIKPSGTSRIDVAGHKGSRRPSCPPFDHRSHSQRARARPPRLGEVVDVAK